MTKWGTKNAAGGQALRPATCTRNHHAIYGLVCHQKKFVRRSYNFFVHFPGGSLNPTKKLPYQQKGKKSMLAFMHDFLAARQWRQALQRAGSVKLDSTLPALSLAAQLHNTASSGHGHASRHQCLAATAHCCGSNEDTSGNSNGRVTKINNQLKAQKWQR